MPNAAGDGTRAKKACPLVVGPATAPCSRRPGAEAEKLPRQSVALHAKAAQPPQVFRIIDDVLSTLLSTEVDDYSLCG